MPDAQRLAHPTGADERAVGRWLAAFALMVFAIVIVGGATRLTESGLSITEWKPVTGVLPPLSAEQWASEFEKYKRIPQYERMNAAMTLAGFRTIYLWEYAHRLVARVIGLAFALPLAWFVLRRRLPSVARGRVFLLLALMGAQGAMGWYMVKSGLTGRTEVSQYRLAAHLLLALVILAIAVWTAADLLGGRRVARSAGDRRRGRALGALVGLVFVTAASGAFVAGLRAGRIYNTFPLMGGQVVPPGYGQLAPAWRNAFENHAAVQFNHRVLAMLTFAAAMAAWARLRRGANGRLDRALHLVGGAATLQFLLGIATLLLAVPIPLGVAHQAGAALLLAVAVLAWQANGEPTGLGEQAAAPAPGARIEPMASREQVLT